VNSFKIKTSILNASKLLFTSLHIYSFLLGAYDFYQLIYATLASVLIGHTDHSECVMDDRLQKKDGTVVMEQQKYLWYIFGITNNI
jgi:hypothetical protein